jgi:hypothetical protein
MSRFMTKRQGGVLLPATTFVVLQTRQSNVKSAGVALTYRAHAGLFYAAAAGPLASAVRGQEDAEKSMSRTGRTGSSLVAPALSITPVYRKG